MHDFYYLLKLFIRSGTKTHEGSKAFVDQSHHVYLVKEPTGGAVVLTKATVEFGRRFFILSKLNRSRRKWKNVWDTLNTIGSGFPEN